jgi:hypothetical protein
MAMPGKQTQTPRTLPSRRLTVKPRIRPDPLILHLRLPPLILLDAPLPRLSPLQILARVLRLGLEPQRLRELALLLEPLELFRSDFGFLMVCHEIFTVRCGGLGLSGYGR